MDLTQTVVDEVIVPSPAECKTVFNTLSEPPKVGSGVYEYDTFSEVDKWKAFIYSIYNSRAKFNTLANKYLRFFDLADKFEFSEFDNLDEETAQKLLVAFVIGYYLPKTLKIIIPAGNENCGQYVNKLTKFLRNYAGVEVIPIYDTIIEQE